MIYLEIIMGLALLALCILNSISDCTKGLIYNKVLLIFTLLAVVADGLYYGIFAKDLTPEFLANFAIVSTTSLILFFSHSFAGGDCKYSIVCALLYPARFYIVYGNTNITLIFAICFALFFGYFYLVISAIYGLIRKKNELAKEYVKGYFFNFTKSFLTATVYISLVLVLVAEIQRYSISINVWILRLLCLATAWCCGRFKILKKWYFVLPACAILAAICIHCEIMPVSTNLDKYLFAFVLMICQMIGKTNSYYEVGINELKPGMILSTISSAMMQGSRVRGLPGLSREDLRDRLTQVQVDSIGRWAKSRKIETLAVVKKIPFAIFISLGFAFYFIIWSVV